MAGRRLYTARQRARAYVVLQMHEGNIKRSNRELGIPEQTLRVWKQAWQRDGVPQEILDAVEESADEFVDEAVRVRDLALRRLEEVIPTAKSVRELATVVGILDDKVARARAVKAPLRPADKGNEIDAAKMGELIGSSIVGALTAARDRRADIVDAEVVEPPALGLGASPDKGDG